jgi:hypothetical protein
MVNIVDQNKLVDKHHRAIKIYERGVAFKINSVNDEAKINKEHRWTLSKLVLVSR